MTPTYYNSPPSPFPENQDHHHHQFLSPKLQSSSSSSSLSYPIFINQVQDQEVCFYNESQPLRLQHEAEKFVMGSKSSFDHPIMEAENENSYKHEHGNQCENNSAQWMSSKMRMMKKMMISDKIMSGEKQTSSPFETDNSSNSSYNNSNTIRVCSDCNTTKTPLWRSGPRGPKSLCNACGIRQRKARRAAAAAAAANGTVVAADNQSMKKKVQHKDKKTINSQLPFKKRCKLITTAPSCSQKKLCFEDFTINFSQNSACQRAFPQELKEAAILLMALSSGLVHG